MAFQDIAPDTHYRRCILPSHFAAQLIAKTIGTRACSLQDKSTAHEFREWPAIAS
jgi:hypothetical protein